MPPLSMAGLVGQGPSQLCLLKWRKRLENTTKSTIPLGPLSKVRRKGPMQSSIRKQRALCLWKFWAAQLNSCNQSGSCLALKATLKCWSKEMICTFMVLLMVWSVPGNLWLSFGVVTFVVPLTRKTLPSSANICCLGR